MTRVQSIKAALVSVCSLGLIGAGLVIAVFGVLSLFIKYGFTGFTLLEGTGIFLAGGVICGIGFMLLFPNAPRRDNL